MPAGGSDSFKETTEGVSAKLNVEVPEKALTTLTALSKQTEAYRVSMEAAERSQGKHQEYLEKMPQIAEAATSKLKEWCDQVERAVDLKAKLGDFAGIPGAVGQDSSNPFGTGTTLGRGDLAHLASDPSRLVSMGNQRGLVDGAQVGLMSDDQIKKLADALTQAVGGGGDDSGGGSRPRRPGSKHSTPEEDQGLSPKRLEEHALKGRDLFGHVIGEMGEGASAGDALGAGRDLLSTMEGAGGMLGKIGGFLGPVGAGVGLALTANQLLQMGGERIQDYRRLGIESGGGMAEGMKYDAQAKMLALDPFITTAQAREVIQGALNAGMGGDQFDNVTGFIAKNLKDMNLAQPYSAKVLTPGGWVKMGELSVDDAVIAGDGSITRVLKISERGTDEVYEVVFDDGTSTRCTMDHLWQVYQTYETTPRVMFLKDMVGRRRANSEGLLTAAGHPRYRVPLVDAVDFPEADLPIDPYTLGVLLGDGSFGYTHVSVHCFEEQLHPLVLPSGVVARRSGSGEYRLTGGWTRWNRNPLMEALRGLGLAGMTTKDKFVPSAYLTASKAQRFALLQGLMDTDGHIDKNGLAFFTNTSDALIEGVRELVLSLGGSVSVGLVEPHQSTLANGHLIDSGPCVRMRLRLPGILGPPCKLARKSERYIPRMIKQGRRTKGIMSVTAVAPEECRCILISHPGHLYVTDDYTVTHNSVAESVKVLQTNVEHGGMSIDQLSTSLANVTALAKRSSEGQSELNADFAANTQVLTGLGVSGPQGDISSQFLGAFANSPLLQGTNTALVAGLASPAFSAQVAMTAAGQGINIGNAGPRVAMQKLAKSGQLFNVTMETLKKMAVMAQSQSGGDADAGVERFQNLLTSQGIQIGVNEARGLYEQLLSPGGMKAAIDSGNAATTEANKPIDQGFVDTSLSGLYTLGNHIGNVLSEGKNVISDVLTFNWGNLGNDVDATNKRKGEIDRQHEADAGMYTTETLKRAVSQYGTANLQVFDSSGKNPQALDQSNKEQRDKLISGDLLIAPQGQKPMSLAQFGNSQAAAGAVGNQNVNVTAAPITVRYEGPITGPSAVPLTTNQQQANAGYGTATDNHAPPGT